MGTNPWFMNVHCFCLLQSSISPISRQVPPSSEILPPTGTQRRQKGGPGWSRWQNLRTAIPVVQLAVLCNTDKKYYQKKNERNKWLFLEVVMATSTL